MTTESIDYEKIVGYGGLDPKKKDAAAQAALTGSNVERFGYRELAESRGESAYLVEMDGMFLAHVEEGLGTKNLVADAMETPEKSYYDAIGQDTVAMIVNDLATTGARPVSVAQHLAVGSSDWFKNERRAAALFDGWRHACELAGCTWGPGETPALPDLLPPENALLSGSAWGTVKPKGNVLLGSKIRAGDAIIFLSGNGIHANGLSAARRLAATLPDGYRTIVPDDGRCFGEALLDPTPIYGPAIEECQRRGLELHYAVNITGHGWAKLLRAKQPFAYLIDVVPAIPPVLEFLRTLGNIPLRNSYKTFNNGPGFALYCPMAVADAVVAAINALDLPYKASKVGVIEASERRRVVIGPLEIEFDENDLPIR